MQREHPRATRRPPRSLLLAACAAAGVCGACAEPEPAPRAEAAPACEAPAVREAVERLGERMRRVSLLAPDSVVAREIREAYAGVVTPGLLDAWTADPGRAPGREVSSPWPERIEVRSAEAAGEGGCRIEGEVVYVSSAEAGDGAAAARVPVVLRVTGDGGWRVSAFEAAGPPAPAPPADTAGPPGRAGPAAEALDVLRRYYDAIAARDYRRAYALWGDGGAASGQTLDEFAAGFRETAQVTLDPGAPGRVEGAAGSRYVEVPVVVRAVLQDGTRQRFAGTYTLRRSVVDGATEAQRRWHLHSADLRLVR